jgi:hypothetical protein
VAPDGASSGAPSSGAATSSPTDASASPDGASSGAPSSGAAATSSATVDDSPSGNSPGAETAEAVVKSIKDKDNDVEMQDAEFVAKLQEQTDVLKSVKEAAGKVTFMSTPNQLKLKNKITAIKTFCNSNIADERAKKLLAECKLIFKQISDLPTKPPAKKKGKKGKRSEESLWNVDATDLACHLLSM